MSKIDIPVLTKTPAESFPFNMNFGPKLPEGETITSVVSWTSAPSGLTVGTASFDGQQAQSRLSDGEDGVKYLQTVVVTTSGGNTAQMQGYLFVRDKDYG